MVVTLLLLIITLAVSLYANYNLYIKYDKLEETYNDMAETAINNVQFIESIRTRVLSQRSYLKQLDRRGAFESDDEVGFFFKELKKIVFDISTYLDLEQDTDDTEKEEEPFRSYISSEF